MQRWAQDGSTMAGVALLLFAAIGLWIGKFTDAEFAMLAGPAGYLIGWPQRRPVTHVQSENTVITPTLVQNSPGTIVEKRL